MRWLRRVHAWAGIALAVIVAVVASSGALLVFEADYLRAAFPAARQAPASDAASLGRVVTAIQREFGSDARSVVFGTPEMGLHQVYLHDGGGAYLDASGTVVDRWSARGRAELWLFDLHENLLAGETGHTVAGVTGFATALFAITGLVLWASGAWRARIRLWPRSARRAELLAHHRELGAVTAVPVLLLALTGAAMVFNGATRSLLEFMLPSGPVPTERATVARATSPTDDWTDLLARAQARFPEATLRIVSFPGADGVIGVRLRQPAEWHPNGRTRVQLALASGSVLEAVDATQQPLAARVQAALYPLHAARVGGRAYDVVAAFSGLALASLSLVGGISFVLVRWRRRRHRVAAAAAPATEQNS